MSQSAYGTEYAAWQADPVGWWEQQAEALLWRERWTRDERAANEIHHPWRTDDELLADYPSHLHIDLLPRAQGRGLGRRLMDTQVAALAGRGSRGVHFFVRAGNQRALGFYRHLGFTQLRDDDGYVLGMRLS